MPIGESGKNEQLIRMDLLQYEVYKRASADGYVYTCDQSNLSNTELDECEYRRDAYRDIEKTFIEGTVRAVNRNDDNKLSNSEFNAGLKFIEENYKEIIVGCLGSPKEHKSLSPRARKLEEEGRFNCRMDWYVKNADKPCLERQNRPLYLKMAHFLWDLITNWQPESFFPRNFRRFQPITRVRGNSEDADMLSPDIIERIRRERMEREERDRPSLRLPLYPPDDRSSERRIDDEESTGASRVIVIEMA